MGKREHGLRGRRQGALGVRHMRTSGHVPPTSAGMQPHAMHGLRMLRPSQLLPCTHPRSRHTVAGPLHSVQCVVDSTALWRGRLPSLERLRAPQHSTVLLAADQASGGLISLKLHAGVNS